MENGIIGEMFKINKDAAFEAAKIKCGAEAYVVTAEILKKFCPEKYILIFDQIIDSFIGRVFVTNLAMAATKVYNGKDRSKLEAVTEQMVKSTYIDFTMKFGSINNIVDGILSKINMPVID